jgi:hypothetical protein
VTSVYGWDQASETQKFGDRKQLYELQVFLECYFHFETSFFFSEGVTNSVALARERTIPTEQPPLVGEVSANFCG